ncbi:MAG: LPS assembly protein LptD [Verrucomicrobiae bacterium]|nr:LPS assembly protein LptD [Verrucomicrobiae bacterium]
MEQPKDQDIPTTADSLDWDMTNHKIVARGHVVATYGHVRLQADRAEIDTQTKQAKAEGHVILRAGKQEWHTDAVEYNFETGAMVTGKARAQLDDNLFFEGESVESGDKTRFVMRNSYLTTCDYQQPGWRLKAGTIVVHPRDKVSLRNLVLYAGSVPIFYFPYMVVPLDDYDISSGTQVQMGRKGNWGFFILNSYTTKASESLRPTYHLDYRGTRGVGGGIDLRYQASVEDPEQPNQPFEEQYPRVSGKIKTYITDDEKIRKSGDVEVITSTQTYNQRIPTPRYQVRVAQRAELREDFYSKLKINKVSDPNFLQDYAEKEFQKEPQPDQYLELTKWSPNTTMSLLTRPRFNNFDTVVERLPEFRYDLKRQPIFNTPLFYEGENSVSYLNKAYANDITGMENYNTTRVDSFHQVLYPKQYFGWLNFTPRAGVRGTFYSNSQGANENDNSGASLARGVVNAGFQTGYKASRTWRGVHSKRWEIDGLRHIFEPTLNYGFVAKPTQSPGKLLAFDVDRSSFGINKNLTPIDFPEYTGLDSINKRNVFRPALRQRLQTRRDGAPWDLAELLVYQDILADKVAGEKTLSDLFTEFAVNPTRWLSLSWLGRYDYDNKQIRESTTSLTLLKAKNWKMSVGHSYFRTVGNQLTLSHSWSINENWTFRTTHRFDPSDGSIFEQAYAIDRDLQSWIVSLSVSQLRPLNHDSDLRVWLTFTLKAFPEVSMDSRQVGGNAGLN